MEGRSPSWSEDDRTHIQNLFTSGVAFSNITDPEDREMLCERVIETQTIIPSLHTFHEDCKYLEPLAKLVRGLLDPKYRGSVQAGMERCYRPPSDNNFSIQTSEAHRQEHGPSNYGFWSAYRQVFLAAMRHFFPLVAGFTPLKMHKVPPNTLNVSMQDSGQLYSQFVQLAMSVGFSVHQLSIGLPEWHRFLEPARQHQPMPSAPSATHPAQSTYPSLTTDIEGKWSLATRCGMPDGTSFFLDREYLYLDNIYMRASDPARRNLTSFAVKRDIFLAFFPPFSEEGLRGQHSTDGNTSSLPEEAGVPLGEPPGTINSEQSQLRRQVMDEEELPDAPMTSYTRQPRRRIRRHNRTPIAGQSLSNWYNNRRRSQRARHSSQRARHSRTGSVGATAGQLDSPRAVSDRVVSNAVQMQSTSPAVSNIIVRQNAKWCLVRITNVTVGSYARFIASSERQFGCIIYHHEQLAAFIDCSQAESFHETMSERLGDPWVANILPAGILSLIPMSAVENLLRNSKVLIMGSAGRGRFDQQMLHPGFNEDIPDIELPYFDGSSWHIGEL